MNACTTVRRAISASVSASEPAAIFIDAEGRALGGKGETEERIHRDLLVAALEVDRLWGRYTKYFGMREDGRTWTVLVRRATQPPPPPPPSRVWVVWYSNGRIADVEGAYASETRAHAAACALQSEFRERDRAVDIWTEPLAVRL